MSVEKLKKIAILIVILCMCIIAFVFFRNKNNNNDDSKNTDGVATDGNVNINSLDTVGEIRNYINLTDNERSNFYIEYGADNVTFTEQGVVVDAGEYDRTEKRLLTNIWPDTTFTNAIVKPEFGKYKLIEVGQTYLIINIEETSKSEIDKYIKEVQKTFKDKQNVKDTDMYYKAYDDDENMIRIYFNDDKATIKYEFTYRR